MVNAIGNATYTFENDLTVRALSQKLTTLYGCPEYTYIMTTTIGKLLLAKGFLKVEDGNKVPTEKGTAYGLSLKDRVSKNGRCYEVLVYGKKVQEYIAYIFPMLKEMIDKEHGGKYCPTPTKEYFRGSFHGKEIAFNRNFGGHRFTDEEGEKLLAGEIITTELQNGQPVRGRLQKLKAERHIGVYYRFVPDFDTEVFRENDSL